MEPIETIEIYLKADIDFASDSGKIKQTVVMTACSDLNNVIPLSGAPVISGETPKLLQHITNNFVTIVNV